MKQSKKHYVAIGFVVLVFTFVLFTGQVEAVKKKVAVKILPDIVISSMSVVKNSETSTGGHNVTISVTLRNNRANTSTGPFKVKMEWTENPTVGFNYLGNGGVTNLKNSMALAKIPSKTLTFAYTVPAGKAYKFRATADYLNQVKEGTKGEANNIDSRGYNNL